MSTPAKPPRQKPPRIPFRRAFFIVRQVWPALRVIIGGISVLVVVAAAIERIVEPKVFTSFGLALWWAIVTVATVGYGDVVPVSPAGRLVGTVVMLFGMAWVPTVTTLVVTALTRPPESEEQRREALRAQMEGFHQRIEHLERRRDEPPPDP
jgi:voltage-gated potassium channel